ncbi:uncharacterized protein LOC100898033 isoform X2 [Galendromus occidentalis]|uniref:Uncharacterized protein LOC100898033 isoform X2 n=1 Tax=Galendromus occidentalis TaxID=34638 RepID=A0AAJ6VXW8_9ACAR|nr:uncharacterized protein LOC100898033 isoform X2 [Galendromus occidentalis]
MKAYTATDKQIANTCKYPKSYQRNTRLEDYFGKESLIVSIEDNKCFKQNITQDQDGQQVTWDIDSESSDDLKPRYVFDRENDGIYNEVSPDDSYRQYIIPTRVDTTIYVVNCFSNDTAVIWIVGIPTEECDLKCARDSVKEDGFEFSDGICDDEQS